MIYGAVSAVFKSGDFWGVANLTDKINILSTNKNQRLGCSNNVGIAKGREFFLSAEFVFDN